MRLSAGHSDLDRYLNPEATAPIAVAVSGGGDSLALLLSADAWARAHGRRLLVLHVDHRLQASSPAWARGVATAAARLGWPCEMLTWEGDKPATGRPAAARAARHGLLADAARAAGARIILMGHTADDLAEAETMRQAGSSVPSPRVFAPSPAWPQGRDVYLLRPLLGVGRATLRDLLRQAGWDWLDDPANDDPRYARARARRTHPPAAAPGPTPAPRFADLAQACRQTAGGGLAIKRRRLAIHPAGGRFLAVACLCASGATRPPRGDALARLLARLASSQTFTATLAGARIVAGDDEVRLAREVGRGDGATPVDLTGRPVVWDGRFELAGPAGAQARSLRGLTRRLSPQGRRALTGVDVAERGALPAVTLDGRVVCPLIEFDVALAARPLALARLHAAAGLVDREPA